MRLGEPYHYKDLRVSIVNFPHQGALAGATRHDDVEAGLDYFVKHFQAWGISQLPFRRLGAVMVVLEMAQPSAPSCIPKLKGLGYRGVYAPFGTPTHQLKEEFSQSGPADGVQC